ncbi:Cytochrome P450 [Mycena venus]|uniref:Cytochrome P450 n=1 Tax=Mycena venus TaxID=2733690 RepID=A0A8H6YKD7_9AGAR|nr:Cytochrome P450 [Mycena venus]
MFLLAGQNNPANTLAFGLIELARQPQFQEQLHTEIQSHSMLAAGSQTPYDEMPLLNAFIKELLRFYPAKPLTDRMAVQDTAIPLSQSIVTSKGERLTSTPVRKGQIMTVAIASYQRFIRTAWGSDVHEFRPSRWMKRTPQQKEVLGPYVGLLAFLGSTHTRLGWGLAILEMQAILYKLVGKFSFALPEDDVIRTRLANTLLPAGRSGEEAAPLRVTRIAESSKAHGSVVAHTELEST